MSAKNGHFYTVIKNCVYNIFRMFTTRSPMIGSTVGLNSINKFNEIPNLDRLRIKFIKYVERQNRAKSDNESVSRFLSLWVGLCDFGLEVVWTEFDLESVNTENK